MFEGVRNHGIELESEVEFTHLIPCGPSVDPVGAVFDAATEIVVSWAEVTQEVDPESTDRAGETMCRDSDELVIGLYQVIVEGPGGDLIADLSDETRTLTVPPVLIQENGFYIFEVLAKEESGNQTITESYFCTGPDITKAECTELWKDL